MNNSNNNGENKGNTIWGIVGMVIIALILFSMCSGPKKSSGKLKDGYHYEYRMCSHCNGNGKTSGGVTCGWCDGHGYYTVQVKD